MSQSETRFVDWLALRLRHAGMRHAFGVPGGGTSLDLIAALKTAGIESVITAREDAAVVMVLLKGGPVGFFDFAGELFFKFVEF